MEGDLECRNGNFVEGRTIYACGVFLLFCLRIILATYTSELIPENFHVICQGRRRMRGYYLFIFSLSFRTSSLIALPCSLYRWCNATSLSAALRAAFKNIWYSS